LVGLLFTHARGDFLTIRFDLKKIHLLYLAIAFVQRLVYFYVLKIFYKKFDFFLINIFYIFKLF